jgi:hypothetical protein
MTGGDPVISDNPVLPFILVSLFSPAEYKEEDN